MALTENDRSTLKPLFEKYLNSDEKFPVDLDEVWKWLGFARKDTAVRSLIRKTAAETDYSISTDRRSNRGRPKTVYKLSINGFKHFAMACETSRAREVRQYFINVESAARQFCEDVARGDIEVVDHRQAEARVARQLRWNQKRDDAKTKTKSASAALSMVQSTPRRDDFMYKNATFSRDVLGKYPSQLKRELGIKKKKWSSRDHMSDEQLSAVQLLEDVFRREVAECDNADSGQVRGVVKDISSKFECFQQMLHGHHLLEAKNPESRKRPAIAGSSSSPSTKRLRAS